MVLHFSPVFVFAVGNVAHRSDLLIAASEFERRILIGRFGAAPHCVLVVPFIVQEAEFDRESYVFQSKENYFSYFQHL